MPSLSSSPQQIRGSGSPTSWSITRCRRSRLHEHHPRRLRPHLADLRRVAHLGAARGGQRGAGSPPAPRRPRACPRWRRTSGRSRGSPPRRRRPGRTGTAASRTIIATPEARASSFSTEATPPRVASRMQRSAGPGGVEQRVDGGPQRAGVGLDSGVELELAAREHDRRAVLADRPETRMRSPGRSAPGDSVARGSRRPMPVVQMYIAVGVAALDDLGVAGRRSRRPPRAAAAAIASTSARSVVGVEALLEDQRQRQRERPRAGHGEVVDRAVDGQLADRAAREADRLDDEACRWSSRGPCRRPSTRRRRPSSRRPRSRRLGTNSPSISVCVALPPAPWAIVIARVA